ASPFLSALARARENALGQVDQRELTVEALTEMEARELALRWLEPGDPAAEACAVAVARESGGNPFFVSELVRHVQAGAGLSRGSILEGEVSLDHAIWRRIERLPEGARNLLAAIAVAGRPLRQEEAYQAADLNSDSLSYSAILRGNH